VDKTQPMAFSADEACDVGADTGSPASPDYGPTGNKFSGEIDWDQIDIGEDSHDHLITPEERLNIAMAKQQAGAFTIRLRHIAVLAAGCPQVRFRPQVQGCPSMFGMCVR